MCKVLAIRRSSYYHWLSNDPSKLWLENEQLLVDIQKVFEKSYQSYGSPRIREDLRVLGYKVSKSRVARIMRANNLFAKRKRKFKATTDSKHNYPVAPNLLKQDFTVSRRNEVWVSDMTYIHTKQGWMYLTVIIDLFNRKIVGWSMSSNLTNEGTIIPAWYMAVNNEVFTEPLAFHSDRGVQYPSNSFTTILKS
tara:strand:- start:705 stop:1286 length:582 start_codon:yes stop_codon:yes gene_type:complete